MKALDIEVDERLVFKEEDGNKGWYYYQDKEGRNPPPFRLELTRLVQEIEAGNIDIVMVWRLERLARDEIVAALLFRKFLGHGVRLFALSQDFSIHTASGYQHAIEEANAGRGYSDRISEDVRRSHKTNALCGLPTSNPSMLGFRSAGKGTKAAVAVESELDVVRMAFDWFVNGPEGETPMSAGAIARRFEELGIRVSFGVRNHKAKDRSRVSNGQISTILRNPAYHGIQMYEGEPYPTRVFDIVNPETGELGPVIPDDMWLRTQEKLDGVIIYPRGTGKTLTCTLTVCPDCGRKTYSGSRQKHARSIICMHRTVSGTCRGRSFRSFKADVVEAWVREHLAPIIASELIAMRAERTGEPLRRELVSIDSQIKRLQATETDSLTALVLAGTDSGQIALIASKLKKDREALELRTTELREKLKRDEKPKHLHPLDLVCEDEALVIQALNRAIQWISITKKGLIVATGEGSIIGARLVRGDKQARGGNRIPKILPPSEEATRECLSWIEHPIEFLEGLRVPTSWHKKQAPDEALVPKILLDRIRATEPNPEWRVTPPRGVGRGRPSNKQLASEVACGL